MSKFELHFSTDNDAFADGELASASAAVLRRVANLIDDDGEFHLAATDVSVSGLISDPNGNTIGSWAWIGDTDLTPVVMDEQPPPGFTG